MCAREQANLSGSELLCLGTKWGSNSDGSSGQLLWEMYVTFCVHNRVLSHAKYSGNILSYNICMEKQMMESRGKKTTKRKKEEITDSLK